MSDSYDVIVVGAGFGGAIAARDLADRGRSVLLLEARNRVGGRAWTRTFAGRSETVELAATWISRTYMPAFVREIDRYGIATKETRPPERALFVTGGERRTALPLPAEELGFLDRANARMTLHAARLAPHLPFALQQAAELDVPVGDFLAPLELPQATTDFLHAILSTWCGSHPDEVSMLHLLGWTAALGGTPYLALYESLVDKFALGASRMVETIVAASGAQLRLSSPVRRIAHEDGGVRVALDDGEATAAACVVAVPTSTLDAIDFEPGLSAAKREALAVGHACRPYKVQMIVEQVPDGLFALGVEGGFQMLLSDVPGEDGAHVLTGFGAESFNPLDVTSHDEIERALRCYVPEARLVAFDAHDWNADPYSRGGWRMNPPGWAERFATVMHEPEPSGRLFFAGTDVAESVLAGWMEGAVVSGYRAADRVTALLGAPAGAVAR